MNMSIFSPLSTCVCVVGSRSSCLLHISLIVPWPLLSCQLQPSSALENQRKKIKQEPAAASRERAEANHYTERGTGAGGYSW